jgi:hypothetical protein
VKDTGGLAYRNIAGQWKTIVWGKDLPKKVEIIHHDYSYS